MPLPDALKNAPTLYLHNVFVYNAFFRLSTCRLNLMAMGSITYFMCTQYAREHEVAYEDIDDFAELILRMDEVYSEHVAKENPPGKKKKADKDDDNGEPE